MTFRHPIYDREDVRNEQASRNASQPDKDLILIVPKQFGYKSYLTLKQFTVQ